MRPLDHRPLRPRPIDRQIRQRHRTREPNGHRVARAGDQRERPVRRERDRRQEDEARLDAEVDREDAFL